MFFMIFIQFSDLPCFQAFKRQDRSMIKPIFSPICCHFLEFSMIFMIFRGFSWFSKVFRTRQAGRHCWLAAMPWRERRISLACSKQLGLQDLSSSQSVSHARAGPDRPRSGRPSEPSGEPRHKKSPTHPHPVHPHPVHTPHPTPRPTHPHPDRSEIPPHPTPTPRIKNKLSFETCLGI